MLHQNTSQSAPSKSARRPPVRGFEESAPFVHARRVEPSRESALGVSAVHPLSQRELNVLAGANDVPGGAGGGLGCSNINWSTLAAAVAVQLAPYIKKYGPVLVADLLGELKKGISRLPGLLQNCPCCGLSPHGGNSSGGNKKIIAPGKGGRKDTVPGGGHQPGQPSNGNDYIDYPAPWAPGNGPGSGSGNGADGSPAPGQPNKGQKDIVSQPGDNKKSSRRRSSIISMPIGFDSSKKWGASSLRAFAE